MYILMCYNAEVSITTYIIGMIGSCMLYKYRYVPEALFYAWVIQMQLIEYFLWQTQPCSDKNTDSEKNIFITKLGTVINHLEPIILWLAIVFFSQKQLPQWMTSYMILFCIVTFFYTKQVIKESECTTVTPESYPHLYWKWNNQGPHTTLYYAYFLVTLVVLSIYGLKTGYLQAIIIFVSFAYSYMLYGKTHSVGSMWCFAAAFGPFVLLYLLKAKS